MLTWWIVEKIFHGRSPKYAVIARGSTSSSYKQLEEISICLRGKNSSLFIYYGITGMGVYYLAMILALTQLGLRMVFFLPAHAVNSVLKLDSKTVVSTSCITLSSKVFYMRASSQVAWSDVSSAGKVGHKMHPQCKACSSVTTFAQA